MSFGGKGGGGGSGAYDYYGSVAGLVCAGPVDELVAVIIDGKEVWPGAAPWKAAESIALNNLRAFGAKTWKCTSAHTSSTGNQPPDATKWTEYTLARSSDYADLTIVGYGALRIYWGTDSQTQDPLLATAGNNYGENHPDYKGLCYFVFTDFLFGRERTSAPNVETVVRRKPSQSIVTGSPANLSDGQANQMAAMAEALTNATHGGGIAAAGVDATSFQATADALHTEADLMASSHLLAAQTTLRSFAADVSLLTDAWVRFNPSTRKVEAGQFQHGVQPSVYTTLTVNDLAGVPQFESQSWRDSKTGTAISFSDRERAFKQSTEKVDDLRAVLVLGENRRETIQRPSITRRLQALRHAAEALRTFGRPQITCRVDVRRERARNIKPGSWVQLDIDVEPGGAQLLQFFKVTERVIPYGGPIQLTLDAEETLTPIPYTPGVATPGQLPDQTVAEIVDRRIFDAPVGFSLTDKLSIGILAVREAADIVGFQPWFGISATDQNLGIHVGFGIKGTLSTEGMAADDTGPFECEFLDQTDIALLSETITSTQFANDEFLLFLFELDVDGVIENDANGYSVMEVMSIEEITSLGSDIYEIAVSRGRRGTTPRAFTVGCEAWIIRRSSLEFFMHENFYEIYTKPVLEGYGNFKLQPFTAFATRPIADCTAFAFFWPLRRNGLPLITLTTPDWSANTPPDTEDFGSTGTSQQFAGYVEDPDADLVALNISIRKTGQDEVVIFAKNSPKTGAETFDVTYTFNATGTYDVVIRAVDAQGLSAEKVLTVNVVPPGSTVLDPYVADEATGQKLGTVLGDRAQERMLIQCDTSGATIEYQFTAFTPAGVTWHTYTPGQSVREIRQAHFGQVRGLLYIRAKKSGLTDSQVAKYTVTND